jgi:hypothetical protein
MILSDAEKKALVLIDNYSNQGDIISSTDSNQKDYYLKMPFLFDTVQKQVAQVKKIVKAFKISHNKPCNQLYSPRHQFDIVSHVQNIDVIYSAVGSLAYYFEVDDVATIYIEENTTGTTWVTLSTISNTLLAGQFTPYSGFIVASDVLNNIRIRFSGSYSYNARNIALYNVAFSSLSRIPAYQNYVLYTMPTDFYQLTKVVLKGQTNEGESYQYTSDFYWEQRNIIAINWFDVGEYSVEYAAFPADITSTTPDTQALENSPDAQECYPFFVASRLLSNEQGKMNVSNTLYAIYQNMLANLDTKIANAPSSIENTFFSTLHRKLF